MNYEFILVSAGHIVAILSLHTTHTEVLRMKLASGTMAADKEGLIGVVYLIRLSINCSVVAYISILEKQDNPDWLDVPL